MAMLALIPFAVIEAVGNGPGNTAWDYNEAYRRVLAATAAASDEFDALISARLATPVSDAQQGQ